MKKSNIFGILSLVFAVVPLVIAVPVIGPFLPLASIIMGIVGLCKDRTKVLSIIGMVVTAVTFIFNLITKVIAIGVAILMLIGTLILPVIMQSL